MKQNKLHIALKVIFSLFMITSATGELLLNEAVVESMITLQMPIYLLYLLGVLKIAGVIVIWLPNYPRLKEWAYAGFAFDFIGAIFSFAAMHTAPAPDIVMAPLALVLCMATYFTEFHFNLSQRKTVK